MKISLLLILILMVLIMLLLIGAEYIYRQKPNEVRYKALWMGNNASSVECIILGTSHTYVGVKPSVFSCKTFNLAYHAQPLMIDNFILNKYEDKMRSLKYIIVDVSYSSFLYKEFFVDIQLSWASAKKYVYYGYYDFNLLKNMRLFPLDLEKCKFILDYLQKKTNVTIFCDEFGWSNRYSYCLRKESWRESYVDALKHQTLPIDIQVLQENKFYVENIIEIAKKHNAKVILLTPPVHKLYRENLNVEQLDLMNSICDSLVVANSNVYRLNYFSNATFTDDDFRDADHLEICGAEKLSTYITQYLDTLEENNY